MCKLANISKHLIEDNSTTSTLIEENNELRKANDTMQNALAESEALVERIQYYLDKGLKATPRKKFKSRSVGAA